MSTDRIVAKGNNPSFLYTKKLFEEFHHMLFENCAKLSEAKPYLDEEELEDMAYETTLKQFYYQALNFLTITRKDENWGSEWV